MGIGRELGKRLLVRASSTVVDVLSRAGTKNNAVASRVSVPAPAERAASQAPRQPPPPPGLGDPGRAAQVFGRRSCPWSGRVVSLLESARVEHSYFELDSYGGDGVLRELKLETKQDTVPYVYIRGRFIGGYNALDEIYRLGQLEYLILPEAERAQHPLHGRIEIAPRRHDGEHIPGA
jgi:glutaredoxin